MEINNKTYSDIQIKISSLLVAVLLYANLMVVPVLGAMAFDFPDESTTKIKMVLSISSLVMIPFSLFSGYIVSHLSKKRVILFGIVLMLTGSIIPAFLDSFNTILIMRGIFGIGYGLVFPMSAAVITDFYKGKKLYKMMGYKSAVGSLAGIGFQLFGGVLAVFGWKISFLGMIIIVPIGIAIAIFLPYVPVDNKHDQINGTANNHVFKKIFPLLIFNMIYTIMQFSFSTNLSIVMLENHIGNTLQVSIISALFTLGSFIMGIAFGKVYSVVKQYMIPLALCFVGTAFSVFVVSDNFYIYILGGIVFGFGFGAYYPSMTLTLINRVHESNQSKALGYLIASQGLGQFISPFVMQAIMEVLNISGNKNAWLISAVSLLLSALLIFVIKKNQNKIDISTISE